MTGQSIDHLPPPFAGHDDRPINPSSDSAREWLAEPASWQNQQMTCAPKHPLSLIRVFADRIKKHWVFSYPLSTQWRLRSDLADAQADLSLCWVHMPICWFCHEAAQLLILTHLFLISVQYLSDFRHKLNNLIHQHVHLKTIAWKCS